MAEVIDSDPIPWLRDPRTWRHLGAAVGLVGAGLAAWQWAAGRLQHPASEIPELRELIDAVGAQRIVDGRLSVAFAYGPLDAPRRSADPQGGLSIDVRLARAKIEKLAAQDVSTRVQHALGVAYLIGREPDRAARVLADAASRDPSDDRLLTDLSVAYLAETRQLQRSESLPRALEASAAALAHPRRSARLAALFNHAVILDALHLGDDARLAWDTYLTADSTSTWAAEARRRRDQRRPVAAVPSDVHAEIRRAFAIPDRAALRDVVRRNSQEARAFFWIDVLALWSAAWLAGDAGVSRRALSEADTLAIVLASGGGDRLPVNAVATISTALAQGELLRVRLLAQAHAALADGRRRYDADDIVTALPLLKAARSGFAQAESPAVAWPELYSAVGEFREGRGDEALRRLQRIKAGAAIRGYPELTARANWLSGLIRATRAELAESLEDYRVSLAAFELLGEAANGVFVRGALMAETFDLLNQPREAWSEREHAFRSFSLVRDSRSRHVLLGSASRAAMRQALPRAALQFQTAEVNDARHWAAPLALAEQLLQRARIHLHLKDRAAAERDVTASGDLLREAGPEDADTTEADLLLTAATLHLGAPRASDVEATSRAIAMLERRALRFRLAEAYLLRGRLYRSLGVIDTAESDFAAAIGAFERARAEQRADQLRIDYATQGTELYQEMVHFQLAERGRPDVAFDFAERGRARALLDALGPAGFNGTNVRLRRASIAPSVVVVYYMLLADRLLTWTLSRTSESFAETRVDPSMLAVSVQQLQRALEERNWDDRARQTAADLHDLLIRPIAASLPGDSSLIIVPDGPLHDVPFATLVDRRTGRFLIEEHPIGLSPSLAVFLTASERLRSVRAFPSDAVVLGNPDLDPRVAEGLPPLEGAAREALAVAALYSTTALVGHRATKRNLLAVARHRDVIHFAGHALANAQQPPLSRLLFARDGQEVSNSVLYAHELLAQRVSARQLVVLAACRTAWGAAVSAEGVVNLARSFIAAGTPTVVATLWDIDDKASAEFFIRFHRLLREGMAPQIALQRAAVSMMRGEEADFRTPSNWAGVVAIGAFSDDRFPSHSAGPDAPND